MPDKKSHLKLAEKNKETVEYLVNKIDQFPEWITIISFYRAVHLVEAVFACSNNHSQTHDMRLGRLKQDRRYNHIHKHYRPLYTASMVARYLEGAQGEIILNFTDYLSPEKVKKEIINHRLRQIEQSVDKILSPSKKKRKRGRP